MAAPESVKPYRTGTCPECEEPVTGEGLVIDPEGFTHVVINGGVTIACQGYFVVNPEVAGLDAGNWLPSRETTAGEEKAVHRGVCL